MRARNILLAGTAAASFLASGTAGAEPYLAVQAGFRCVQCHANPTGGGLRSTFGNAWAQTQMSAGRIGPADAGLWLGKLGEVVSLGGNLRTDAQAVRVPGQDTSNEFEVFEARVFLEAQVIPGRLAAYLDQRLAPGNATNLEANLRLTSRSGSMHLKAGRMYLPFGWRLEDDNALVRQLSGVSMQTPDEGVEVGLDSGAWSAQLALSNGSAGGPETDDGKQLVTNVTYVRPSWRLGASGLYNDSDAGDRAAAALYAALRIGPTAWLAEIDYVDDDGLGTTGRELLASLVEVNWRVRQGHNLKLTYEWLDPDTDVDEDEQTRASIVYEWSPFQFLQLRLGYRRFDGPRQIDFQNRSQGFVQLHGYF